MTHIFQDYSCVKYTIEELEEYLQRSGSCVKKVEATYKVPLYQNTACDMDKVVLDFLTTKLGAYEEVLKGIILGIHKARARGSSCIIRSNSPILFVNLRCDCYVFQPEIGAIISGKVRLASNGQVAVIVYRIFNACIRLVNIPKKPIEVDSEIFVRIFKYNLSSVMTYIEGELVGQINAGEVISQDDEMESDDCIDHLESKAKRVKSSL